MTSKPDNSASTPDKPGDYQPTPRELQAVKRVVERQAKSASAPRFRVSHANGKTAINPDHPDVGCAYVMLADFLATGDSTLAQGVLTQPANAAHPGKELTTVELSVMVATVGAIAPRDPTEALLASEMAAIHTLTMMAARRLHLSETIQRQDSASNMVNKLARTFAAQMEALKRYRSTGEQSIRVQHVTVNEGGQAIVGNVRTGGGGTKKIDHQSHVPEATRPSAASSCTAMLCHEQAVPLPVQSACDAGAERVPVPRRQGGGPGGEG